MDVFKYSFLQTAVAEQGCAAIAASCLRNPDNCQEAVAQGAANAIIKAMHIHVNNSKVQASACRYVILMCQITIILMTHLISASAVRNLVARNRELCDAFLTEGAERYINIAMNKHANCADDAKAALRDLGCKVELKELWKGAPKGADYVLNEEDIVGT